MCPDDRQTSSCCRNDCGTASARAAHRLAGSGRSIGVNRAPSAAARRNGHVFGSSERSSSCDSHARAGSGGVAGPSSDNDGGDATAVAARPGTWNGAVASAGASVRDGAGTANARGASGAASMSASGPAEATGTTSSGPSKRLWLRRRSFATVGVWAFGSMSVRRRRGRGAGGVVRSSATHLPLVWTRTARSLVPFAPCRADQASARLGRQGRSGRIADPFYEASKPAHGAPAPGHPATNGCLSPGAPSHQALHVSAVDRRRGWLGPRVRRGVPLPGSQDPYTARRPRVGDADLQLLHGPAHLPPRRGLRPSSWHPQRCAAARAPRPEAEPLRRHQPEVFCASEAVCKPSSVPIDADASSRMAILLGPSVARRLLRPTRGLGSAPLPRTGRPAQVAPSYLALLRVEFARFTPPPDQWPGVGIVTVALVLVSRRTGVTRHPALWSSDFPHDEPGCPGAARPSDRLAGQGILPPAEVAGRRWP